MVEIRLHGALAKEFGMKWVLDIGSAHEAIDAINVTKPGFKQRILDLAEKGFVYRVRTRTMDLDEGTLPMRLGMSNRLDIIPLIAGAGAGFRFVLGAALVIGAVMVTGGLAGAFAGGIPTMFAMGGVSLMLGAVTQWLTPIPKAGNDATKSAQSWTLSGPTNNVDQGNPVPIIYGEVLAGSYPVSSGIVAAKLSLDQAAASSLLIGGNANVNQNVVSGNGLVTVKERFSASPLNMVEPFSYSWSKTGFADAVATRLINTDKSTVTLEIDINTNNKAYLYTSGSIALTINGKNGSGESISATGSKAINVSVSSTTIENRDTSTGG